MYRHAAIAISVSPHAASITITLKLWKRGHGALVLSFSFLFPLAKIISSAFFLALSVAKVLALVRILPLSKIFSFASTLVG